MGAEPGHEGGDAAEAMARRYGVVSREALIAEPGLVFLRAMIEGRHPAPPMARAINMLLTDASEGRAVFEGVPTEDFFNPSGTVHGGWAATILDSAMGCAVHATLEAGQGYTTVEMKLNFVRAVMPASGRLTCEGVVIHRGGTIATSEGKLYDASGKLFAHGTETCMIFDLTRRGA